MGPVVIEPNCYLKIALMDIKARTSVRKILCACVDRWVVAKYEVLELESREQECHAKHDKRHAAAYACRYFLLPS